MRSFPLIGILIFLLVYIVINIVGYYPIRNTLNKKKHQRIYSLIFLTYSTALLFVFFYIYIYPNNARKSDSYSFYLFFNVVLFNDLIIKAILFLFSIPYFFTNSFRKKVLIFSSLILSLCITLTVIFGVFIGRSTLRIINLDLNFKELPTSFDGFKIVQISDLHLGSFRHNQRILFKINTVVKDINPDLILFTGDLVNNFGYETHGWSPAFTGLTAHFGKFSILGNHDYGDYYDWPSTEKKEKNFNEIVAAHKEFGFQLLRNSSITISNGNDSIYLIGVENWGHPPFPQYADLERAVDGLPEEGFKILLTHDPSHWVEKINGKEEIQLTLSGHTHGLQWALKPGGVELSLMALIQNCWAGLYGQTDQYLYVNRGIGTIGLNSRIDMPAEVTVITLRKN